MLTFLFSPPDVSYQGNGPLGWPCIPGNPVLSREADLADLGGPSLVWAGHYPVGGYHSPQAVPCLLFVLALLGEDTIQSLTSL